MPLIFGRNKSGRQIPEAEKSRAECQGKHCKRAHDMARYPSQETNVYFARASEHAIEPAQENEPARLRRPEDCGTECRAECQRVHAREQHRGRHGHRELAVELTRNAREQAYWHEDGSKDERRSDDRSSN